MGGKPTTPRRKSVPHAERRRSSAHHREPRQSHGNIYLNPIYTENMLRATFNGSVEVPDCQQYYFPYNTTNDEYGQWDGEGYFFTKAGTTNENSEKGKATIDEQPILEESEVVQEKPVEQPVVHVENNPTSIYPEQNQPVDEDTMKEEPIPAESEEESEEEVEVIPQEIRLKQRNRRRLALVIGNNDYSPPHQLHSCCKDAEDMAAKLKSLNFDCTLVLNAKQRTMLYNEKRFTEKIRSGDCILYYYSGHAMEDKGKNYLVPIHRDDLKIAPEYDFICLDDLIKRLSERKDVVNIIIIDACRTDEKHFQSAKSRTKLHVNTPAFGKPLSNRLNTPDEGEYMIIYGCEPGQVSISSNPGESSIFTAAFLKHIDQEEKTIEAMMKDVRRDMRKMSNAGQRPWIYSCLAEKFFFKP